MEYAAINLYHTPSAKAQEFCRIVGNWVRDRPGADKKRIASEFSNLRPA